MPSPHTMSTSSEGVFNFMPANHSVSPLKHGSGDVNGEREYIREFFHKEECLYSHQVYKHAAAFFDVLKHDTGEEDPLMGRQKTRSLAGNEQQTFPDIDFETENEKRLTFNLVFSTLKYQRFLENMLEDCSFFHLYPEFRDDFALVMVMVCDFKQRKFEKRTPLPGEQPVEFMIEIEEAFHRCKTKLNAALARSRIKARVLDLDHLLPDSVRQKDKLGSNMHLYCWVNQMKTELNTVLDTLRDEGFSLVDVETKLLGKTYMLDHQCSDLIAFASDQRGFIEDHPLVVEAHLVIQDKSSCVGPQSIRHLINEGDDIVHVNVGSGLTTAHLASLTHHSESHIYAFGVQTEKQHIKALHNLEQLGVNTRVKVINENILQVEHSDERVKHAKVVLITAECSRSAVANPVNFLVTEGEDTTILKSMSLGLLDDGRTGSLSAKHSAILKHVLRFPRVQGIVYYTRSSHKIENEGVVERAIEYVNKLQPKKAPFRLAPPVIPLSDVDIERENPLNGKYLRYPPSSFMSGCFVATITREADDPKEAAKDILARAAARGILSGVPVSREEKARPSKNRVGRKKSEKRRGKHAHSPRRTKSAAVKEIQTESSVVSNLQHYSYSHSMPNAYITSVATSNNSVLPAEPFTASFKPVKQLVPVQARNFPDACADVIVGEGGARVSSSPNRLSNTPHANKHSPKPTEWRREEPPHRQVIKHPAPFR